MELKLNQLDAVKFARIAAKGDLDEAVASFGDAITAGEYAALKQLDRDDLRALLATNNKINEIRAGGLDKAAWTCVNVVC